MKALAKSATRAAEAETPLERRDWPTIERDLDAYGCAVAPKLLSSDACRHLLAMYADDSRFRSPVVMAKRGFGKGE